MRLFHMLFGCRHKRMTRPITIGQHTYRACLACGMRFAYDWQEMRITGVLR